MTLITQITQITHNTDYADDADKLNQYGNNGLSGGGGLYGFKKPRTVPLRSLMLFQWNLQIRVIRSVLIYNHYML